MYIIGNLVEELKVQEGVKVAGCSKCGSTFVGENRSYTRNVKQGKAQGGKVSKEEVVQLYCKRCGKLFILLPDICFKYLRYEKEVVLETQDLIICGGTIPGYAASHVSKGTSWQMHRTTPMRWTQEVSEKNPILVLNRKVGCHLSGVLCLDEVHYRVNGKKVCGLAAIDPNGNWLVHFKQVKGRDKDTIREFLQEIKDIYPGEDILFFVTDGYKGYIEPMQELFKGAKHQLCKFHVMRDINREIRRYRAREKKKAENQITTSIKEISKDATAQEKKELKEIGQNLIELEKIKIDACIRPTQLQLLDVLQADNIYTATRLFENLQETPWLYEGTPMEKWVGFIKEHWSKLTLHYDYPQVPATNNAAEQFFSQFRKVEDQRSFRRSEEKYSGRIGAFAIEYNFSPLESGCHKGQNRIEVSGIKLERNILAQAIDSYMLEAP